MPWRIYLIGVFFYQQQAEQEGAMLSVEVVTWLQNGNMTMSGRTYP